MTIFIIVISVLCLLLVIVLTAKKPLVDLLNLRPKTVTGNYGIYERYINGPRNGGGRVLLNRKTTKKELFVDFRKLETLNNVIDGMAITDKLEIKFLNDNTWVLQDVEQSIKFLRIFWSPTSNRRLLKEEVEKEYFSRFRIYFMQMNQEAMKNHLNDIKKVFGLSKNNLQQIEKWVSEIGLYKYEVALRIEENFGDIALQIDVSNVNPNNNLAGIRYQLTIDISTANKNFCVR